MPKNIDSSQIFCMRHDLPHRPNGANSDAHLANQKAAVSKDRNSLDNPFGFAMKVALNAVRAKICTVVEGPPSPICMKQRHSSSTESTTTSGTTESRLESTLQRGRFSKTFTDEHSVLGKGAFGTVINAKAREGDLSPGANYAVKIIPTTMADDVDASGSSSVWGGSALLKKLQEMADTSQGHARYISSWVEPRSSIPGDILSYLGQEPPMEPSEFDLDTCEHITQEADFQTEMSSNGSVDDGFFWVGSCEDYTTQGPPSPQRYKQPVVVVIVMELCEGVTLRQWLADNRASGVKKRDALRIFEALSKAVRDMHANGIVHRDIKPDNIIISEDDGEYKVQIIDFDLAMHSESPVNNYQFAAHAFITVKDEVLVGTPWYAAPEARSKVALASSNRSLQHLIQLDLFPLAVVLMEMFLLDDTMMGRHKAIEQYRLTGHVPLPVRRQCPEVVAILRRLKSGITANQLCVDISRMGKSVLGDTIEEC